MFTAYEIVDSIEVPIDGYWRTEIGVVEVDGISLAIVEYADDGTWFRAVPIRSNLIKDIPPDECIGTTRGSYPFKISSRDAQRFEGRVEQQRRSDREIKATDSQK